MKTTGKVTVKDIAQRMGISLSTVNKALTGKPGISEKRRGEVVAAAREMGYEVNHVAQSLSRKPMNMGIIIPSGWKHYFSHIENGMKKALDRLHQSNVNGEFRHIDSPNDILSALRHFDNGEYDIIIYCPSHLMINAETADFLKECKTPIILAGGDSADISGVCTVSIDAELSGRMAADFLGITLGGSGKVTVLMGSKLLDTHISKTIAFVERARELGLTVTEVHETGDDPEVMAECVKHTYAAHPDLKGIYIATGGIGKTVEYLRKEHKNVRPYIVATDVYSDVRDGMESGDISAVIFQNQVLIGKLAVECAYKYLVEMSSYRLKPQPPSGRLLVTPHLFLRSNLDCFISDDGNDYRAEA